LNVAAPGEANDLTSDTVLLVGECKGGEGGRAEDGKVVRDGIQAMKANKKLDIAEPKWRSLQPVACIFAWSEKKKESKSDHVGDCKVVGCVGDQRSGHDVANDVHRNGLDLVGRGILSSVVG
jgi:hypothetical protein